MISNENSNHKLQNLENIKKFEIDEKPKSTLQTIHTIIKPEPKRIFKEDMFSIIFDKSEILRKTSMHLNSLYGNIMAQWLLAQSNESRDKQKEVLCNLSTYASRLSKASNDLFEAITMLGEIDPSTYRFKIGRAHV